MREDHQRYRPLDANFSMDILAGVNACDVKHGSHVLESFYIRKYAARGSGVYNSLRGL